MKPVVGVFVLLLFAVVATASAMVVEDLEVGESYYENLELAEKEQAEQTEVGKQESQNEISIEDSKSVEPEILNFRQNLPSKLPPESIPDLPEIQLPKLPPKSPSLSPPKLLPELPPSARLPTAGRTRPQNTQCGPSKGEKTRPPSSCVSTCVKWVVTGRRCVRRFLFICVKRIRERSCAQWGTTCSRKGLSVPVRSLEEIQQEEAAKTAMLAESQKIFSKLYDERVVKAEKYELSTSDLGDSGSEGEKPVSVVISLTDGRRFEVIQEPKLTERELSTILVAYNSTDDWKMVETKDIQSSKVIDFVRASDSSVTYKEAVKKMLALD